MNSASNIQISNLVNRLIRSIVALSNQNGYSGSFIQIQNIFKKIKTEKEFQAYDKHHILNELQNQLCTGKLQNERLCNSFLDELEKYYNDANGDNYDPEFATFFYKTIFDSYKNQNISQAQANIKRFAKIKIKKNYGNGWKDDVIATNGLRDLLFLESTISKTQNNIIQYIRFAGLHESERFERIKRLTQNSNHNLTENEKKECYKEMLLNFAKEIDWSGNGSAISDSDRYNGEVKKLINKKSGLLSKIKKTAKKIDKLNLFKIQAGDSLFEVMQKVFQKLDRSNMPEMNSVEDLNAQKNELLFRKQKFCEFQALKTKFGYKKNNSSVAKQKFEKILEDLTDENTEYNKNPNTDDILRNVKTGDVSDSFCNIRENIDDFVDNEYETSDGMYAPLVLGVKYSKLSSDINNGREINSINDLIGLVKAGFFNDVKEVRVTDICDREKVYVGSVESKSHTVFLPKKFISQNRSLLSEILKDAKTRKQDYNILEFFKKIDNDEIRSWANAVNLMAENKVSVEPVEKPISINNANSVNNGPVLNDRRGRNANKKYQNFMNSCLLMNIRNCKKRK